VAHLAADDQLLLVAAGQRGGGDVDAGRADVVLLDDAAGVVLGALDVEPDTPLPRVLGFSVTWPRMRFSQSGASRSRPWRWRSSGM
jgi:hypothetical protein